jgi:hypothetical protein
MDLCAARGRVRRIIAATGELRPARLMEPSNPLEVAIRTTSPPMRRLDGL